MKNTLKGLAKDAKIKFSKLPGETAESSDSSGQIAQRAIARIARRVGRRPPRGNPPTRSAHLVHAPQ